MLVVNLFGGSCTGKSTHSAGLFCALKKQGFKVEYVREACKDWFYDNTTYKLDNQMLITGKQIEQTELYRLGGCDIVVTDSPILLGAVYSQLFNVDINLSCAIRNAHHKNDNYNILLERDIDFDTFGRGSGNTAEKVQTLLDREGLVYDKAYKTSELDSYKLIVNDIKRKLNEARRKLNEARRKLNEAKYSKGAIDIAKCASTGDVSKCCTDISFDYGATFKSIYE